MTLCCSLGESEEKQSSLPGEDVSSYTYRVLKLSDRWLTGWLLISVIVAEPENVWGDALKMLLCLWCMHVFCSDSNWDGEGVKYTENNMLKVALSPFI